MPKAPPPSLPQILKTEFRGGAEDLPPFLLFKMGGTKGGRGLPICFLNFHVA